MRSFRFRAESLLFSVLLLAMAAEAQQIPAANAASTYNYTYSVLYSFCSTNGAYICSDGFDPVAGLIQDAAGNLYGATSAGGASLYTELGGAVFKVDTTGHETVLYSFCSLQGCTDGQKPEGGLIQDSEGNLYGTTNEGGSKGYGTVFKVDTTGHETVLYNFCSLQGCTDGEKPEAGLIQDSEGNLYGTASLGGAHSAGTVFKVDTSGNETVLYSFCSVGNCLDGSGPAAGLIQDSQGNLYGTTANGGATNNPNGGGTIFEIDNTGHYSVLYSFCSVGTYCTDGKTPLAGLIRDSSGNLYGTTSAGGPYYLLTADGGSVFKLDTTGHLTALYNFCSVVNAGKYCPDGATPAGGVVQDADGNLYGTTSQGGTSANIGPGGGTVFVVDITGHETILYNFCSVVNNGHCLDGEVPLAGLLQDAGGNLYGTAQQGGANGNGVVFKLLRTGTQPQTITFPNPGPLTYGVGSIPLIAAASSGLQVSFAVISESPANVATVSGDTLTVNNVGSVTVQATQAGNATYAAATPVSDPITVIPAPLTVTADNALIDYGWPIPVLTGTFVGVVPGDGITASYSTTAVQGSAAGMYPITPKLNDPNGRLPNYSVTSTNGTLTIGSAATSVPLVLSLSPASKTAGLAQFTLTVTGANFDTGAVLLWNGEVRATHVVGSTQLTATILKADIAAEATNLVTVVNPSPDAGTSSSQPFAVQSSTPVGAILGASLADTPGSGGSYALVLTGVDFTSGSTVDWSSAPLATTYLNPWTISAVVPSSDYTSRPATVTVGSSQGFVVH